MQNHQEPSSPEEEEATLTPKQVKYVRRFLNVFGFLGAILAGSYFRKNESGQLLFAPVDTWDFWASLLFLFGSLFLFALARFIFGESPRQPEQSEESRVRVQVAEEQLEASLAQRNATQGSPERDRSHLALANLWTVTHARLHQYHGIALGQAKKSFRNAQGAMLIGFALLVGFTVLALKADSAATSAAAAVLGSASAALAGFVSRTFIRSQESAAAHLQRYFDQPLEFSRYLAAERLIVDSELDSEKRAEVLSVLVQAMISGPPSVTQPTDGENSGNRSSDAVAN
ncbi:hypothetical protein ACN6K5_006294 [Streptomyces violaceoruber]|uniref:TRADD-N-associated membrane domain-containing protein n=1 Tax=Streptomyces violaceoruber group TaxID=2867121 RepID=UPI0033D5BF62